MSMNMSLKQANEMELARFALNGVDEDVLMDGTALELDKSWHVLHFLFTGHPSHGPMPAAALAGRIDVATMERLGIYAADDDSVEDVDYYFPQLQAYVDDAAKQGRGLVIWMM